MSDLVKLALALAADGAARHGRQVAMRMAWVAVVTVVAAGFAVAAIACMLAALWIYALPHVGAAGAPLVVGGVLLAISLAGIVLLRYALNSSRRAPPAANATPALLLAEATRLLKEHKGPVLAALFLAGLVAGSAED